VVQPDMLADLGRRSRHLCLSLPTSYRHSLHG